MGLHINEIAGGHDQVRVQRVYRLGHALDTRFSSQQAQMQIADLRDAKRREIECQFRRGKTNAGNIDLVRHVRAVVARHQSQHHDRHGDLRLRLYQQQRHTNTSDLASQPQRAVRHAGPIGVNQLRMRMGDATSKAKARLHTRAPEATAVLLYYKCSNAFLRAAKGGWQGIT